MAEVTMGASKSFRISLRIYASIVFIAALSHAAWHWYYPTYTVIKGLDQIQFGTLYLLNWSVGLLLLFFSILAFWISSPSFTLKQARIFSALMITFWAGRFVLELIFPLQIPFMFIPNPSFFIKILLILVITVLALPELWFRLKKGK